ncbi:MAG: hypothetical protein QOI35_173 [Cryptosporangiaceae bacterium]|nr:hypothetical protein [Cryptosporangiaceae bacterium]MDQ1658386.1 hypothetical protein [Cryptosporangiaceae bacterium]
MSTIRGKRAPVVITEAEESPQAQLRSRQRKYLTMMGLRLVCLAVATLLVGLKVPHALAWAAAAIAAMVALPWMAVLIANDRPPKKSSTFSAKLHRRPAPEARELPAAGKVIDE